MGSNEAGERRAGKEEVLPRLPDGLIQPFAHVDQHMQVQANLPVHSYNAKEWNHFGATMGAYFQWRYTQINTNTTVFLRLQVIAVCICECVQWVADEGETGKVACCIASVDAPMWKLYSHWQPFIVSLHEVELNIATDGLVKPTAVIKNVSCYSFWA